MASAYTSFAADGLHTDPVFVTKVRRAQRQRSSSTRPRRRTACSPRRSRARSTRCSQQVVTRGHRRERADRPAGRGQDRHRRELEGRVVRRLDAAAHDRGVGRLPAAGALDGAAPHAREGHRRHCGPRRSGASTRAPRSRRRRSSTSPRPAPGTATASRRARRSPTSWACRPTRPQQVLTDTGYRVQADAGRRAASTRPASSSRRTRPATPRRRRARS